MRTCSLTFLLPWLFFPLISAAMTTQCAAYWDQPHRCGGGPRRRRTCGRLCRRRRSRRTSPGRPAEAEWGSAPGYSFPNPTENHEIDFVKLSGLLTTTTSQLLHRGRKMLYMTLTLITYRLSEVTLSCHIVQTQTYPGLMQPH